jgi:hypothetical protein
MDVDFNDPESVRVWVAVCPPRHRATLAGLRRLPLFQGKIQALIDGARRSAPAAAGPAISPTNARGLQPQGALL